VPGLELMPYFGSLQRLKLAVVVGFGYERGEQMKLVTRVLDASC
jgi:hypothetical protein